MKPWYQSPDGTVQLFLGDCREILPVVAPPSPNVLVLGDVPYGVKERTKRATAGRGKPMGGKGSVFAAKNPSLIASRDWPSIVADDIAFDASWLLGYPRLLLWGANHYLVPPSPSWIVWDKRDGGTADDNADCEVAWTNLGGPIRRFGHTWRGVCRASERGEEHLHPTQKPEAFYRWLFAGRGRGKPIVNPGDLIVVPYAGSGPEIPPAMELGLSVIAIDVEEEYLETIVKHRIEPAIARGKQIDLWAPREPAASQSTLFDL